MMTDDEMQERIEATEKYCIDVCEGNLAEAMLVMIATTTNMAKDQGFPMTVFHKMIDEFGEAWDEFMPNVLRN